LSIYAIDIGEKYHFSVRLPTCLDRTPTILTFPAYQISLQATLLHWLFDGHDEDMGKKRGSGYPQRALMLNQWGRHKTFVMITKVGTGKTIGAVLKLE
jgi:hypothetical protein